MKNLFKAVTIGLLFLLSGCTQASSVWILGWQETASLNIPRAGAAVVVADGFIYMIGGVDGRRFLETTEYAKIQQDGSLGPWQPGPSLNEERGFAEAIVHNGFIYVVGGGNGPYGKNLLRSAERARILPDGSLDPWVREKSLMVVGRRCSKVVVKDNHIYVFGGFGGVMLDNVERAGISGDGSLEKWTLEPETMTLPRYVNGVKKVKGMAYVIGGHDERKGVGITEVERAEFIDSGGLKAWEKELPLQTGRYGLATAAHGDYLYALGGITGVEYLEDIEKTKIGSNGKLAEWQSTTALSTPRAIFSVVTYKDWIYVLGGTNRDGYLTSVEFATFNDAGDIGFSGSKEDAAKYKEKAEARAEAANKTQLPNEGVVMDVVHAEMYSYIKISGKDGIVWLAAPKIELDLNTRIRYSEGVLMSNFYSKELKRNFPAVIFVGQVEKVEAE
jgi:N-acetylneuraminic acid mutarotase